MKQLGLVAVAIVAGAVAGTTATLVVQRLAPEQKVIVQRVAAENNEREAELLDALSAAARSQARAATDQEGAKVASTASARIIDNRESDDVRARVTEEEWREHRRSRNAEGLARHDSEPYRAEWAGRASRNLQTDLSDLNGVNGPILKGVDCRSESCTVALQWNNYDTAKGSYEQLLHREYKENCPREILLDEPADTRGPYQAKMIFWCKDVQTL